MTKLLSFLLITSASFLLMGSVSAQSKQSDVKKAIVGSWDLVGDVATSKDGAVTKGKAFGENPIGRIIFMSNGQYFNLNTKSNIPKFASGSRLEGTPDENKAVAQGAIAHYGTYTISPDGKELILKTIGSSWPGWVGIEQKRPLTISSDQMVYKVSSSFGGTVDLAYKRVK